MGKDASIASELDPHSDDQTRMAAMMSRVRYCRQRKH